MVGESPTLNVHELVVLPLVKSTIAPALSKASSSQQYWNKFYDVFE